MNVEMLPVVLMFAMVGAIFASSGGTNQVGIDNVYNFSYSGELKKFESPQEIKEFIKKRSEYYDYEMGRVFLDGPIAFMEAPMGTTAPAMTTAPVMAGDFSTTNIQVAGVDEADFVKNDGRYIYIVSGGAVSIVDAYPPEGAKVLSEITVKGSARELYINGDTLVIIGDDFEADTPKVQEEGILPRATLAPSTTTAPYPGGFRYNKAVVYIYDVTNRTTPKLQEEVSVDGAYFNSRMIGDYVYMIATQYADYNNFRIPEFSGLEPGKEPDVYYFDEEDYSYIFTSIISVPIQGNEGVEGKIYLLGSAQNMFVSQNNVYITYGKWGRGTEKTIVHKIKILDGEIEYNATGEVPGHVLNQFSMDEFENHFRVATTTGFSGANHIYVLDEGLEIVGKLENLAPGESIYSARFMGEKGYLVTFKKVDPLFVIDLKDPENPEVLGKLKIPGYSDYLHPYDENHIIGIGKDTVGADGSDFGWYQGVKLALFDVSDVENPREISKMVIGDRGTESPALHDHRAFLFDREKNLLVIPVVIAKISRDRNYDPSEIHYGKYVWEGAYVLNIDTESGITLRGGISHDSESEEYDDRFYYGSQYSIKRSLYMGDVLYTISEGLIKMNDLDTLDEINNVSI
jgi:uncharacterized secreted protein with C-terminal beta-propeller domain